MENHTDKALRAARRLRRQMSLPEVLLSRVLRNQPMGVKFRRQHPIGDFVADFYCARRGIIVEIDGISHDMGNRPDMDASRDEWLRSCRQEIVRIPASEVLRDVGSVAEALVTFCTKAPPPSAAGAAATSPTGRGLSGNY